MLASSVIEKLNPLLSSQNSDLINAAVRLLLNLSFDTSARVKMVKSGLVPRLVSLLEDTGIVPRLVSLLEDTGVRHFYKTMI